MFNFKNNKIKRISIFGMLGCTVALAGTVYNMFESGVIGNRDYVVNNEIEIVSLDKAPQANAQDNKMVTEERVNYASIKDVVINIEDAYYGTVVGDVFGEIEERYFAEEVLYSEAASYTAYASSLMQGNANTASVQVEQISDKNVNETKYVEEKKVVADCKLAKGKTYSVTEEEYEMLTRIVEAEAGGEDLKGKILVANVVLNRVSKKGFPNTIEGVIFERNGRSYQFQPASGKIFRVKVSKDSKKAVDKALAGDDYSNGALFFVSTRYASTSWFDSHLKHLFTHGNHAFYK